jgi:SAM-dependent methyltransferase
MSVAAAFDDYADQYDAACQMGLAVSGESRDFFAQQRVAVTQKWLAEQGCTAVGQVADYGCGVGNTMPLLRDAFPAARLLGLEVSPASIRQAHERWAGDNTAFSLVGDYRPEPCHDVVYCNGVFHHIPPKERPAALARIVAMLRPGGYFALWENNPWNPGTRLVMSRIPFDRDAITLTPPEARSLVRAAGLAVAGVRFYFYFPRFLAWLRGWERFAVRVPLGAQYLVLARKAAKNGQAQSGKGSS